jgi:thiamine-monophosphate kinase
MEISIKVLIQARDCLVTSFLAMTGGLFSFFYVSERNHEYDIIFIMKVSKLGEFGLINLLAKMIAKAKVDRLSVDRPLIGIGDDAAVWHTDAALELATVDTMVQDVHFSLDTITWRELGWKSLAINLSDIAAMGGEPEYILAALALPEETTVADISALYEGMIALAKQSRTAIIGGNISRAPQLSITITVIGRSLSKEVLRRSAARPGDMIAVTGHPGSAAAGLEMLSQKLDYKPDAAKYLKNAFVHPVPRLDEGQLLLKHGVKAAIDTSDGLLGDLRHICEASKVGACINTDQLPVHPFVRESYGEKAHRLALSGGEDYELLFTAPAAVIERVKAEIKCPVTVIGNIVTGAPGSIEILDSSGRTVKIDKTGWQHF